MVVIQTVEKTVDPLVDPPVLGIIRWWPLAPRCCGHTRTWSRGGREVSRHARHGPRTRAKVETKSGAPFAIAKVVYIMFISVTINKQWFMILITSYNDSEWCLRTDF